MVENDNGNSPSLDAIVLGLKALQQDLEPRETAARAALEEILTERRRIDQMIRAAERTGVYTKPGPKGPHGNSHTLSEEALEEYFQRLKTLKFDRFDDLPDGFNSHDIQDKLGVHKSTSQRIVRSLREQGRIRLVGQRYPDGRTRGGKGKPSPVYVLNDA